MAGSVRLVLTFHNHQPVGNFDGVFDRACQDAYLPFLDVVSEFPDLPFGLHISGSLLEWLERNRPDYIRRLQRMVRAGQIEIIGGAFYEPILANIPRRDRIGQIRMYSEHLNALFDTNVRGMWLPERVWEQSFAGDISAAGIEYTIIDDYHFRCAGMKQDELAGYYVTEDEGRTLFAFPNSERLRYLIPFSRPEEVIEALQEAADRFDNPVLVFGDDGEKFGSWPETFQHVYTDGWLRTFLKLLRENASWIQVTTPSRVLDMVPPVGRCYLPDASYREMTEWVLPPETQKEFVSLVRQHPENADWQKLVRFTRGGFWRNFRVRYPETHEMYCRMIDVSSRLAALQKSADMPDDRRPLLESARRHLYRGQCNCSYWHGAFGGLYLPHLRNAVFRELIEADSLLERATRPSGPWIDVETADFNLDARPEIRLANHRMVAWISPAGGGHLYELDVRATGINLLATLNRRPEPYHQRILDHVAKVEPDTADLAAISKDVKFKQPHLDRRIVYDKWPRKSLVDLFLEPDLTFNRFRAVDGVVGDFATGDYSAALRVTPAQITAELQRSGSVAGLPGNLRKSVVMTSDRPNEIVVHYEVDGFDPGVPLHLAVEMNFAAMPGGAADRYFYDASGRRLGMLDSLLDLRSSDRLSLVDEWLGVDVTIELSEPAGIWAMPVETISQSEDGFEAVHQSVSVVPHWQFTMPPDRPWSMEFRIIVDTSVAAARILGGNSAHRSTGSKAPEVAARQPS